MIKLFRARNSGCLLDVKVALTPLHAFIGPNDSGKSTLLHGMRTLIQLASNRFAFEESAQPFDPFLPVRFPVVNGKREPHDITLGCAVEGGWYVYDVGPRGPEERVGQGVAGDPSGGAPFQAGARLVTVPSEVLKDPISARIVEQLRAARLVRFDPDALREPRGLIPETAPVSFLDDRGTRARRRLLRHQEPRRRRFLQHHRGRSPALPDDQERARQSGYEQRGGAGSRPRRWRQGGGEADERGPPSLPRVRGAPAPRPGLAAARRGAGERPPPRPRRRGGQDPPCDRGERRPGRHGDP